MCTLHSLCCFICPGTLGLDADIIHQHYLHYSLLFIAQIIDLGGIDLIQNFCTLHILFMAQIIDIVGIDVYIT